MTKKELPPDESPPLNVSVVVPADLRGCHPLISQTRKVLEKTTPHHIGLILRPWQKGILNISVTRESVHRALRLMQALITAPKAAFESESASP